MKAICLPANVHALFVGMVSKRFINPLRRFSNLHPGGLLTIYHSWIMHHRPQSYEMQKGVIFIVLILLIDCSSWKKKYFSLV